MSALVSFSKLTVTYNAAQHPALRSINLVIEKGEKLAIIGESGSGKSTLALAVSGLLPPAAQVTGTVGWADLHGAGRQSPRAGRDIGFIFQEASASLDPIMPVGKQVAEVVRTHLDLGWQEAGERAKVLLERVRLPDPDSTMNAYPHQLSGGQKQRVAIAAAIAANPGMLIADEATSALDTVVQAEIVALIRTLADETGMTLLFISHDIALAAQLADRIAVLHDGELVELGEALQLVTHPQDANTRSLLDANIGLKAEPLLERRS